MQNTAKRGNMISTRTLVVMSILSAISYLLMFIQAPIPGIFPDFLKSIYQIFQQYSEECL